MMHFPPPLAVLLALLTTAALSVPGDHTVSHFILINAATNTPLRRLTSFDVITPKTPFTITAVPTGGPSPVRHVTFVSPSYRREYVSPYALAGDFPPGNFFPSALPSGEHQLSAYVDNDAAYPTSITIRVLPSFPQRGPLPTDNIPRPLPAPELPIPRAPATCTRTTALRIAELNVTTAFYDDDVIIATVKLDWCTTQNDKARLRMIAFEPPAPNTTSRGTTFVLSQKIADFLQYETEIMHKRFCNDVYFFIEACVIVRTNVTLCSTSALKWLPKRRVPEPRLKWRPPIALRLAPGDHATVKTLLERSAQRGPLDNGGFDMHTYKFAIRGVVEHPNGTMQSTPSTPHTSVDTQVPLLRKGVALSDSGTLVYLNYSLASCLTSQGTWRRRYNTTVLVDPAYKSLIKQDDMLPTFEKPVYPPTRHKEPVELRVVARNPGGGMREEGVPTKLHYQWYLRTRDYLLATRTYAEPIPGATSSTLRLDSAECHTFAGCSRWGCFSLRRYYVDVCNTFGCRRSDEILPDILPPRAIPDGKVWSNYSCELQDANL